MEGKMAMRKLKEMADARTGSKSRFISLLKKIQKSYKGILEKPGKLVVFIKRTSLFNLLSSQPLYLSINPFKPTL
jgi:hypothetical protein